MDSEETLKYLQQKYPEDLNENYRCYWWCTSNIDGSALTYYLVLHDKFCETDKEPDTEENEPEEDIDDAIDELKREINELKEIQ